MERPVCCGLPMQSFGYRPCPALSTPVRRYRCRVCLALLSPGFIASRGQREGVAPGVILDPDVVAALPSPACVYLDPRGYPVITLGITHPYANSGGWQYLARYVVMTTTGEPLHRDEEVHHDNGNRLDCRRENLKVMLAEHHGRHHARYQLLYMLRDRVTGRWLPSDVPAYADQRDDQDSMRYSDEAMQDYDDGTDAHEANMHEWWASETAELEEIPF